MNVVIRTGKPEDAPRMKVLADENGLYFDDMVIDWERAAPYWLLAHADNALIGMVQMCPGVPITRFEMLMLADGLSLRLRALTMREFLAHACTYAVAFGAQVVSVVVPDEHDEYLRVLLKRGAVEVDHGTVVMMRAR
jgi:hypothetical protein